MPDDNKGPILLGLAGLAALGLLLLGRKKPVEVPTTQTITITDLKAA